MKYKVFLKWYVPDYFDDQEHFEEFVETAYWYWFYEKPKEMDAWAEVVFEVCKYVGLHKITFMMALHFIKKKRVSLKSIDLSKYQNRTLTPKEDK